MPEYLDMPSYLTDENAPVLSLSGGVIGFDSQKSSCFSPDAKFADAQLSTPPSRTSNRSFLDSVSPSSDSELSSRSRIGSRDSTSSMTNGKDATGAILSVADSPGLSTTVSQSWSKQAMTEHGHSNAPLPPPKEGVASYSLPDRVPNGKAAATQFQHENSTNNKMIARLYPETPSEDNSRSNTAQPPLGASSTAVSAIERANFAESPSTNVNSSQQLPALPALKSGPERDRADPQNFLTHPQTQALSSPAMSPPSVQSIYPNSHGGGSTSITALPTLRPRHPTLRAPRAQPQRHSRDDSESAYATGRFSPTAVRRGSTSLGRRNTRSMQSEVVPEEEVLRWTEAYRQKRAKKKLEDDDRVLVGTKVDEKHRNWVTAYNMLTGIRVSVSRTNAKLDRELTDQDFVARQKSTFDIAGNELVPSAKYDFKFKDYAPWVFRSLRSKFNLDPADYLMSLTGKYILSELGSPGKSGSFFYFSRDYKYIIKTIHHAEHKFLRKILKDYYLHVSDNPNTLLSQFYGLHRVKTPWGKKIHFVVMNNLFPPHRDIHMTFDLKGSTIGREYHEEDIAKNPRATLKDLNWTRRHKALELGLQKKRLFLEQLQRDVQLLQKLEIMDYSLLVGIHDLQRGNDENLRDKTLKVFNPGGEDGDLATGGGNTVLMRTSSRMEGEKKARELRQMLKAEKPMPMGHGTEKMPDTLEEPRKRSIFYVDDGGFGSTHADNSPADEVYYLGVIDCLTHYGFVKKMEVFFKGLTQERSQISALPPDEYGERFYHFIESVTMSPEEATKLRTHGESVEAAPVPGPQPASAVPLNVGPDRPPPTPPKPLFMALKNADSGYADRLKAESVRSSLDKALPPLPPSAG